MFLALWRNFWICEERFCLGGCGVSWTPSNRIHFANTRQLGSRTCYGFMVLGWLKAGFVLSWKENLLLFCTTFGSAKSKFMLLEDVASCGHHQIEFSLLVRESWDRELPHGNEVISWTRLQSLTMVREQVFHLVLVLLDSL